VRGIVRYYTASGVRSLEREISKSAARVVSDPAQAVTEKVVVVEDTSRLPGREKYDYGQAEKENRSARSRLAWTEVGGTC